MDAFKERIHEKAGTVLEGKEKHRERLTAVIMEYAPELLVDFQSFWEAHDALHEQLMAERDAVKAEIEALKAALDVSQEVIMELHMSLKVAVEAEDGDAIAEILEEMLELHPQHLAFDEAKLELLMTL